MKSRTAKRRIRQGTNASWYHPYLTAYSRFISRALTYSPLGHNGPFRRRLQPVMKQTFPLAANEVGIAQQQQECYSNPFPLC